MTCKEITVAEWNELNYREDTYFANGCIFDEEIDNLIAFSWYEDELHEVGKYYKVVDKFIIPHSKEELAEEWIKKENTELKADNDARKFAMAMSEKVEKQLREENAELKEESDFYNKERGNYKALYLKEVLENKNLCGQIEKMKRCEICKHYRWNHCSYEINISADCIQNKMKHFELREIKEK